MAWYFSMVNELVKKLRAHNQKDLYGDKENREGIYLFLSFDLANATEYKIRNHEWHHTFKSFYDDITKEITKEDSPIKNARIWKFIGDEVLFYLKVTKEKELFESLPYVYKVIRKVEKNLSNKSHYYDKLHLKTTMWIADVLDEQFLNEDKATPKKKATNIIFTPPYEKTHMLLPKPDFLGFEIDLGFRISKYSHHNAITIGAKFAYLLFKNRQLIKDNYKHDEQIIDVDEKLKIISYENFKGIWRNHQYPIIWYSEEWNTDTMFLYDEHHNSFFVQDVKQKIENGKLENIKKLEKIFEDVNQIDDVDAIIEKVSITPPEQIVKIQPDKVSEVHVALICFNKEKTKLLAAHRPNNKERLPDMWEFGCGQVSFNETFEQTAKRTYKEDFGIDIEILNDGVPIATYSFKASSDQIVPGIILVGYTDFEGEIKPKKHDNVKWLSKKKIKKIDSNSNEYVEDFRKNALRAFEVLT